MNETIEAGESSGAGMLAYLQLFRLSNLPTAMADVLMGFLVVQQTIDTSLLVPLLLLLLASSLLYVAGMVLNDVFDYQQDCHQRPDRPLPSGRISLSRARLIGLGMLVAGVGVGMASGLMAEAEPWRGGLTALLLATAILLYDGLLKQTPLAPLLMGSCRCLNVLLGMSFVTAGAAVDGSLLGLAPHQLWIAVGMGAFVTGITLYARSEAGRSSRPYLAGGVAWMIAGVLLLAYLVPRSLPDNFTPHLQAQQAGILLSVLSFTFIYRCLLGIAEPSATRVQAAVKQCLLSIIVLDAAITAIFCPWGYAILVLALLAPTLLLGKWLYST